MLNSIESGANINVANLGGGTNNLNKKITETWVDPMIVARIKSRPDKKFVYQLRGDIGGFGIGSELAWEVQAYAGYRFSKLFQLTGGYRVISLDYTKGSGDSRFLYDVNTFGPVIRFGFNL
jgi:phospholipid N-methyltransferase